MSYYGHVPGGYPMIRGTEMRTETLFGAPEATEELPAWTLERLGIIKVNNNGWVYFHISCLYSQSLDQCLTT